MLGVVTLYMVVSWRVQGCECREEQSSARSSIPSSEAETLLRQLGRLGRVTGGSSTSSALLCSVTSVMVLGRSGVGECGYPSPTPLHPPSPSPNPLHNPSPSPTPESLPSPLPAAASRARLAAVSSLHQQRNYTVIFREQLRHCAGAVGLTGENYWQNFCADLHRTFSIDCSEHIRRKHHLLTLINFFLRILILYQNRQQAILYIRHYFNIESPAHLSCCCTMASSAPHSEMRCSYCC